MEGEREEEEPACPTLRLSPQVVSDDGPLGAPVLLPPPPFLLPQWGSWIVEGGASCHAPQWSFREFFALREVRGAFEEIAAGIAADEDCLT